MDAEVQGRVFMLTFQVRQGNSGSFSKEKNSRSLYCNYHLGDCFSHHLAIKQIAKKSGESQDSNLGPVTMSWSYVEGAAISSRLPQLWG